MITREQATEVLKFLRTSPRTRDGVARVVPVGSYRRKRSISKDLDVLVQDFNLPLDAPGEDTVADARKAKGQAYLKINEQTGGEKRRQIKGRFHPRRGRSFPVVLDLFKFSARDYPYALLAYSGDATFVMRMRAHAKRKGLWLDQYGLYRRTRDGKRGSRVYVRPRGPKLTERDIFRYLGYAYKPPAERETVD